MSFTVDVNEPKLNRPNTMNLVEKRAQELGLCEDLVNGRARSLGDRIVNGVVEERVKVRPRALSEDEFFFSSSDTPPIELLGVLRITVLSFVRSLWLYIFFCSLHLRRPSVDCANHHLSVCPIQRFPPLAVSCSGQHGTV